MKWVAMRSRVGVLSGIGLLVACCIGQAFAADAKPALQFNSKGKFKVVQITDTHWNEDTRTCQQTMEVLNSVLDREKPDLVAFTGDIVTLKRAPQEGWKAITEPIVRRKIPWAVALGNHDDEQHGVSRRNLVKYLVTLPGSQVEEGPASLDATGNYIVHVAGGASAKPAAALYFLDSHAYPTIEAIKKCKDAPKYGWLSFDQIQWYRQSSRKSRDANGGKAVPALAFFHIPLQEYANPMLLKTAIGTRREKEGVSYGALNSGMFAAMVEEGDVMGVFVGHDHDNDYAGSLFGVCLAYGRCSGFSAYGSLPRGARVIELTEGKREFESWIRTLDGAIAYRFSTQRSGTFLFLKINSWAAFPSLAGVAVPALRHLLP